MLKYPLINATNHELIVYDCSFMFNASKLVDFGNRGANITHIAKFINFNAKRNKHHNSF